MLQEARKGADEIISNANDTGREAIKEAEEKAKLKADSIVEEAHRRIDQDAARVRKQLESELVGLVADATEAVIEEKVDAKKDEALIKRALKEIA
jgi:F-type H+-transporting ATPase subunit b